MISFTKNQCGIKAVVFNKIGDCLFLLSITLSYFTLYTFDLELLLFLLLLFPFYTFCYFHLPLFIALCTKSAQFPFSSWLIYAMSAPTPISALLHSSTMVIAGFSNTEWMMNFVEHWDSIECSNYSLSDWQSIKYPFPFSIHYFGRITFALSWIITFLLVPLFLHNYYRLDMELLLEALLSAVH